MVGPALAALLHGFQRAHAPVLLHLCAILLEHFAYSMSELLIVPLPLPAEGAKSQTRCWRNLQGSESSPGASSVPANREPHMTAAAPSTSAFAMCPADAKLASSSDTRLRCGGIRVKHALSDGLHTKSTRHSRQINSKTRVGLVRHTRVLDAAIRNDWHAVPLCDPCHMVDRSCLAPTHSTHLQQRCTNEIQLQMHENRAFAAAVWFRCVGRHHCAVTRLCDCSV